MSLVSKKARSAGRGRERGCGRDVEGDGEGDERLRLLASGSVLDIAKRGVLLQSMIYQTIVKNTRGESGK